MTISRIPESRDAAATKAWTGSQSCSAGGKAGIFDGAQGDVVGDEAGDGRARGQRHLLHRLILAVEHGGDAEQQARPTRAPITRVRRTCSGRPPAAVPGVVQRSHIRGAAPWRRRRRWRSACRAAWRAACRRCAAGRAGSPATTLLERLGLALGDLQGERRDAGAGEGGLAGDQFVEHDAERKEIRPVSSSRPNACSGLM